MDLACFSVVTLRERALRTADTGDPSDAETEVLLSTPWCSLIPRQGW